MTTIAGEPLLSLSLTLPLGPSVNRLYKDDWFQDRLTGGWYKRRTPTAEMKAFKVAALADLVQQVPRPDRLWQRALAVKYHAVITVATAASDLSNRLKAFEDVVAAYLGFDDNKFVSQSSDREIDKAHTGIALNIYLLEVVPETRTKKPRSKKSK